MSTSTASRHAPRPSAALWCRADDRGSRGSRTASTRSPAENHEKSGSSPFQGPSLRYHVIDMAADLVVEGRPPGTPGAALTSAGDVLAIEHDPGGRVDDRPSRGHPDGLVDATRRPAAVGGRESSVRTGATPTRATRGRASEFYLPTPRSNRTWRRGDTEPLAKLAD